MFKRWDCFWAKSWAYRIFKKHHTQLNDFYWVNRSASNMAFRAARGNAISTPASSVFTLSPADMSRINYNIGKWTSIYKEYMNWVRLSSAVSLCSYLEIYLRSVITLAIESDPATLLGASREVDGAKLLKRRNKYNYSSYVEPIVNGTWQSRINKYDEYFGLVPPPLKDAIGELEDLRNLRNGVGHVFGRELGSYKSRTNTEIKQPQRLSESRLKKWLGMVETVALTVDEHLRTTHIGSYELVSFYHSWDKNYPRGRITEQNAFKEMVHKLIGNAPGIGYIGEMIDYYNKL